MAAEISWTSRFLPKQGNHLLDLRTRECVCVHGCIHIYMHANTCTLLFIGYMNNVLINWLGALLNSVNHFDDDISPRTIQGQGHLQRYCDITLPSVYVSNVINVLHFLYGHHFIKYNRISSYWFNGFVAAQCTLTSWWENTPNSCV